MASTLKLAATVAVALFAVLALGMAQPREELSCSEQCDKKGEQCRDPALCLLDGVVCVSRCERIVCQNLCSIAAVVCKTGCSVGDTGCRAGCSKQQVDCLADNCPT